MSKKLKVLVHGAGFARQGHTDAFRHAGAQQLIDLIRRNDNWVDVSYLQ